MTFSIYVSKNLKQWSTWTITQKLRYLTAYSSVCWCGALHTIFQEFCIRVEGHHCYVVYNTWETPWFLSFLLFSIFCTSQFAHHNDTSHMSTLINTLAFLVIKCVTFVMLFVVPMIKIYDDHEQNLKVKCYCRVKLYPLLRKTIPNSFDLHESIARPLKQKHIQTQ